MTAAVRTLSKDARDFIDDAALERQVAASAEDPGRVRAVIAKSLAKEPLTVEETAALVAVKSPELRESIFQAARELKRTVYGNRIVLFAPLYIGNYCVNDCKYCGFRSSLRTAVRMTLTETQLKEQIEALEDVGHKRLILVFGEHPQYTAEFIADTVRQVYSIRKGHGEIRRVNINAAPLEAEGFRTVKAARIGTYQVFQETYHHPTYREMHPVTTYKGDFLYRLDSLSRAYEAGCDDVGIGALFGLYDWRYEVLGLVTHARFLMDRYGCGPHTISFPRIRPAHGMVLDEKFRVSDDDFKFLVAVLRLAVPYTGLILTARETAEIRREVIEFGVSQIDAGTRIELAGYGKRQEGQELKREQFQIGDLRSLEEIVRELMDTGHVPSFCTSCYRQGRTGQQFMEYAIPGFIERFCTPNALVTLEEYLQDYASPETREAGHRLIHQELERIPNEAMRSQVKARLEKIRAAGAHDLYF